MAIHKVLVTNKKARFDFEILETVEAGLALEGREAKSLRLGRASLKEAFVMVREGEMYLYNMHINGYPFADLSDYEPTRTRKLLLKRKEIDTLEQKVKNAGMVLVPVEAYFSGPKIKVLVGLGRGRKQYQKKELIKRRDVEREVRREFKERLR